ncbi:unnamed protein product [Amoebophrya sp. A25]|nr:unnamed protein product [Amoebophrya sp. A25]|eukprot:GSA25T00021507001.1
MVRVSLVQGGELSSAGAKHQLRVDVEERVDVLELRQNPPYHDSQDLAYQAPSFYPFNPHGLVMETIPKTCNLFLMPHLCREWSEGKAFEFDPHNRDAAASVLHNCLWREQQWTKSQDHAVDGQGDRNQRRGDEFYPATYTSKKRACYVVDVGANVGMFTALAASMGAYVASFEPQGQLTAALQNTVAANVGWRDRVKVFSGFATFDRTKRNLVKKVLKTKYRRSGPVEVGLEGVATATTATSASTSTGRQGKPDEVVGEDRESVVYEYAYATGEQYRLGDGNNFGLFRCKAENVTFTLLQDAVPDAFDTMLGSNENVAAVEENGTRTIVTENQSRTRSATEVVDITLLKIDTDSIDGELLRGFLDHQSSGLWNVHNWIFEGTGVTASLLYSFLEQKYTIYMLNMHIGFRFFNSSGWDIVSDYRPLPPSSGVSSWGREVFSQRLIRYAIQVKSLEELETDCRASSAESAVGLGILDEKAGSSLKGCVLSLLEAASWPRREVTALAHFFVTDEQFEETPVLRWVHTGPWWPTEEPGSADSKNRYAYPHPKLWDKAVYERVEGAAIWEQSVRKLSEKTVTEVKQEHVEWKENGVRDKTEIKKNVETKERQEKEWSRVLSPHLGNASWHYRPKRNSGFLLGDGLQVATPVRVNGTFAEHYRGLHRRRRRWNWKERHAT